MAAAYFYHLTGRPLEATLSMLLEKSLQAGWRVAVRGRDATRLARLDEDLWRQGGDEAFVPHGCAGGPHDALQPVLLTTQAQAPNGAACVISIDGAEILPDELRNLSRVCILFDGMDPDAVQTARDQWRAFKEAGVAAQYWAEEGGHWRKKAESASSGDR